MIIPGPSAATVIATAFTLIGIAAAMIGARLYLRRGIQRLPFNASDILMCAAWLASVVTSSFDIVFYNRRALHPGVSFSLEGYSAPPEEIEYLWKLQWAVQFPFFTSFYLSKATLLTLYAHFFPVFMQKRRKVLWGTMAYCACAYVSTVAVTLLICKPIEGNWSTDPTVACDPIVFAIVFQVAWALNFAADIMIFCLPFLVIFGLQLRRRVKISIYCTFLLGIINLVFTVTRFLQIQLSSTSFLSFTLIELWSTLDLNIGLIIACLPTLRPYLSLVKEKHTTASSNSETFQKRAVARSDISAASQRESQQKSGSNRDESSIENTGRAMDGAAIKLSTLVNSEPARLKK